MNRHLTLLTKPVIWLEAPITLLIFLGSTLSYFCETEALRFKKAVVTVSFLVPAIVVQKGGVDVYFHRIYFTDRTYFRYVLCLFIPL